MLLQQVFFELFSCLPCNRLHSVALGTCFLFRMQDDNVERYTNLQLVYTLLSLDRTLYRHSGLPYLRTRWAEGLHTKPLFVDMITRYISNWNYSTSLCIVLLCNSLLLLLQGSDIPSKYNSLKDALLICSAVGSKWRILHCFCICWKKGFTQEDYVGCLA